LAPTPSGLDRTESVDALPVDPPKTESTLATALTEIRRGNSRALETDVSRALDFDARVARRRNGGANAFGAESKQGDTMDLQSAAFLTEGATRRRAVGMVEVDLGPIYKTGTGFLVSPELFLTNCHVLLTPDHARACTVWFDKEVGEYSIANETKFKLDVDRFYLASP
jgi:endonuclease G